MGVKDVSGRYYVLLFLFLLGFFVLTNLNYFSSPSSSSSETQRVFFRQNEIPLNASLPFSLLHDCSEIYMDVGSNVGIQIRKLFEPHLYPNAPILKIFTEAFGTPESRTKNSRLCALGFEPNPSHTDRLKALQRAYSQCGWKVFIFTETAVSDRNGMTSFFSDNDVGNMEWGGSIVTDNANNREKKANVHLVRLSQFLKENLLFENHTSKKKKRRKRRSSNAQKKYNNNDSLISKVIVMKMDIEGSEVEVLGDMALNGVLNLVTTLMVEWHEATVKDEKRKKQFVDLRNGLTVLSDLSTTFKIRPLDDESFYTSNFPLPSC